MRPEDSEDVAVETAALVLAEELGSRLKKDMRTEVEAALAGFLEEMKAFPQSILQEAGANRKSMLKALDEQLQDKEGNGTTFEQEFERLRKKAETAEQVRIAAERDKDRVEALSRSLAKEKARVEEELVELQALAETRLREKTEADLNNEILGTRLRSSKKVSKIMTGVLLIFILAAAGYVFKNRPGSYREAGVNRPIAGIATGIAPKAGAEKPAGIAEESMAVRPGESKEDASVPARDSGRQAVEPPPKPEPPKPKSLSPIILAEVYFPSGSINISEDMTSRIRSMAERLTIESDALIHIEGYSDDERLQSTIVGRYIDNIGLSQARAGAIARLFISSGMTPERIRIIGMGADKPFVPNSSPENRAKNRRVVIKTIGSME